jgi:pimeloyl-ACP methyl ester carboxylesterase
MNALATACLFGLAAMPLAANAIHAQKPMIVLVHGAFADASSWDRVIPILQGDGYFVTAVQIPLSSLSDDVAATRRVLDGQTGPVVLVGHSWGGAVITAAAARARFHDAFARDLPEADTRIMAATQKPIKSKSFGETVPAAAWKTIPSWYIVSTEDHAINPDLERYYAKRIGATTIEIKGSHVPFLSHPKEVARVIEAAAK